MAELNQIGEDWISSQKKKKCRPEWGVFLQTHYYHMIVCIANKDADRYQRGAEMWVRQNQAGGLPLRCFLSDVWLYAPRRIVHKQYFGDEERRQRRGGGGWDGGGGGAPFPKGLKGWMCAMYVWEQSKLNAGILLKICARQPPHPERKHITGAPSLIQTPSVVLFYHMFNHKHFDGAVLRLRIYIWQIYDTLFAATKTILYKTAELQTISRLVSWKKMSC